MRNTVLWIGLLLMIASFAWMQWISKPEPGTSAQGPARHEPFSVVVLDPGHGGQDSGAKVGNMLEKDLTLDVAQRVDRLLQSEGLATVMTRVGDGYVSLAERAALTNRSPECRSSRGFRFCSGPRRKGRTLKVKVWQDLFKRRW